MQHNYSKSMMIALAIAFMALPVVFVSLRLWAKKLSKRIGWDDALTIAALSVSLTCSSLQLAEAAIHGHLGSHQPVDAEGQAIMDDPGLIFFEEAKFAINLLCLVGLGLTKCSILVLYMNIFTVRKFRIAVYCVLAYVIGWTVSFTFSHLFTCYPITVFIEPYYGNNCVQTVPMFLASLYTDVIADMAILILPIPMIASVRMKMRKKIAVVAMLTLGTAACAISITRVIATYSIAGEYLKHPNDVIYYTSPVFFWANIELSLGVVCACLPTLRPIWFFFYPREATQKGSGYDYSSSNRNRTKDSSSAGKRARKPYMEIDELELTKNEDEPSTQLDEHRITGNMEIMKSVTIHQTLV